MATVIQEMQVAPNLPNVQVYHPNTRSRKDRRTFILSHKEALSHSVITFDAKRKGSKPPASQHNEMSHDTFITYTHPDQQNDKSNRKKIATYIGTHYRNRSRPAARKAASGQPGTVNSPLTVSAAAGSAATGEWPVRPVHQPDQLSVTIHRDSHGFRDDPFATYPIEATKCVSAAIDYCELLPILLGSYMTILILVSS